MSLDPILNMSPEAQYIAVMAILLPWLAATVNNQLWGSTAKQIVVAILCIAVSAGWFVARGELLPQFREFVGMTLLILVGATLVYKLFKKPVSDWEERSDSIARR